MSDTKSHGASTRQAIDFSKINPLIEKGDTSGHVQSVLGLLSFLIIEAADGDLALSYEDAHGLAMILDTCKAALANDSGEVAA